MKQCFKCQKNLPLSEYYKHPAMGDGHLNKCKQCTKRDSESRRLEKEKDPNWIIAERKRHREKSRKYRELGLVKKLTNDKKNIALKRYRNKYPEKELARSAVARALKSGKIHRHPCCVCGAKAEAHHEDYSKPLDVIWFCSRHHAEHHVNQRKKKLLST